MADAALAGLLKRVQLEPDSAAVGSPRTTVRLGALHTDSDALGSSGGGAGAAPKLCGPCDEAARAGAAAAAAAAGSAQAPQGYGGDNLARMTEACRVLLECLGEDPGREGLVKTPQRMAKALLACTAGYTQDARAIVSDALFESSNEEMVVVRDIDCYSMCEHHMLPFFGRVSIGYLPQGRVVGLSKLARLTDCFAKRLQIQEKLAQQIAQAVHDCVGAAGVAVTIEATHMCMTMRGVEKPGSVTVTSAFTGAFKDGAHARELRAEFAAKCVSSSRC